MNKERAKRIGELRTRVDNMVNLEELGSIASDIEGIADEEQEYYDNMPESLQQGEKGQNAEQAASNLVDAKEALDNAVEALEQALTELENATSY